MTAALQTVPPVRPASAVQDPAEVDAVPVGEVLGTPTARGLVRALAGAVLQPGPLTRELASLAAASARIARGTDRHLPAASDRRFQDAAWADNPLYRRLSQEYVASCEVLDRLLDSFAGSGADWHDVERARFAAAVLKSALSPTNTLVGNPAALKRAFDTAGRSVLLGARNLLSDVRRNGGLPSQADRSAYRVGRDMALSPGAVVLRTPVAELLQYTPTTTAVRARPVLVIPPPIGRFYFLDLRPGRSFVEYAVSRGLQVFMLSWKNPQPADAAWGIDTYAATIVRAMDAVRAITGSDDVNTLGFCAGGILQTGVLNADAATGAGWVHSASYAVTLLDFDARAPLGAFSSARLLELASGQSKRKGVISARAMSTVFSLMRPDDLVFNYVVSGWLLGEAPPAFDILAWNADGTNLPARLHAEFLEVFRDNGLVHPGQTRVLDQPVDLSRITVPTFVTGALTDHLTPWKGCFRTRSLLGGPSTFVLSNAGHVASLVNPPGNPKASYYEAGPDTDDPDAWLKGARQHKGSWWEAWAEWVLERSGAERPAPSELGDADHPPLDPAPGRYVTQG